MPLTIAHSVLARPLSRGLPVLPVVPLVIGTLVPDAAYLIELAPDQPSGHSLAGVMTIGIPLTLALWWFFVRLARPALVARLPSQVRTSVEQGCRHEPFSGRRVLLGATAAVLGAASHIAWDSLTHSSVWPHSPFEPLISIPQDLSTAVGLALLLAWTYRWIARQPPGAWRLPADRRPQLIGEALVCACLTMAAITVGVASHDSSGVRQLLAVVASSAMAGAVTSLATVVLLDRLRSHRAIRRLRT